MDWKLNAYDSSELAAGNAGHAFLRENAAKLGLQYIIWNRKSWSPSNGYRDYNGVSPHTDHLHIGTSTPTEMLSTCQSVYELHRPNNLTSL